MVFDRKGRGSRLTSFLSSDKKAPAMLTSEETTEEDEVFGVPVGMQGTSHPPRTEGLPAKWPGVSISYQH